MGDETLDRVLEFAHREPAETAPSGQDTTDTTAHVEGADQMAKSESDQVAVDETVENGASPQATESGPPSADVSSGNGASSSGSGLSAPGTIRGVPIPAGAVLFGELSSAFVDGPSLLRNLGDRRHTGALVDAGSGGVQVAILHEGNVIALVSAAGGGTSTRRLDRLALPGPSSGDEHELTVLAYRPEVSLALGQLVNLPERFERMHGSFVDLPALLSYLRREKANGAVRVTTGSNTGIVLIRGGEVLGAFTRQRPELEDAEVVYPLAREGDAEIDVHVGTLNMPPASVSAASVA